MLTALALCLAADAGDLTRPIELHAMTLEQARTLRGLRVEVFLEAGCPVDVRGGYTMVGGYGKDHGIEWGHQAPRRVARHRPG